MELKTTNTEAKILTIRRSRSSTRLLWLLQQSLVSEYTVIHASLAKNAAFLNYSGHPNSFMLSWITFVDFILQLLTI